MNEWTSSLKEKGAVFSISVFILVLLLVGMLFQEKIGELLTNYTEHQTRRQAEALASQAAEKLGKPALVHVKLDTGLHRLGFTAAGEALKIKDLPGLDFEGIFDDIFSKYTSGASFPLQS